MFTFGTEGIGKVEYFTPSTLGEDARIVISVKNENWEQIKATLTCSPDISQKLTYIRELPIKFFGQKIMLWFDEEKLLNENIVVSIEYRLKKYKDPVEKLENKIKGII